MLKRHRANLLMLLAALFVRTAHAFFDPPYLTPASPVAGEIVSFNIRAGICDAFGGMQGFPQISRTGNAILYVDYGAHYEDGDELCIFPTWNYVTPIGSFEPGNYTFTLQMAYYDSFGVPSYLNMGTVTFTVAAAPSAATPLPINEPASLWALVISLLGAAALAFQFRRSSR
ncbi:MAG: hypothetical protein ABIS07_06870 [Dokdonella sp.]